MRLKYAQTYAVITSHPTEISYLIVLGYLDIFNYLIIHNS